MSDLSALQRSILKWLLHWVRIIEQDDPRWLKAGIDWVPEWTPKTEDKTVDKALENSFRASLCRSLARLEQRGLIKRVKGPKNGRTRSVVLTAQGRKVAEAMMSN